MTSYRTFAAALPLLAMIGASAAQAAPMHGSRHAGGPKARMSLRYAGPAGQGASRGHRLVNLVGDRESGLGFYALPRQFRASGPPPRDRRGDAIRYAVASEAGVGYYYGLAGDAGYGDRHHHTLFNPVDGYGSPFFAGYYGAAGDPDDDNRPLFGRPYED